MTDLDKIETNREAYQLLRKAERVEEEPSVKNSSNYDSVVVLDGDRYGVDFDGPIAESQRNLREAGAEVYGSREERGSKSAGVVADDFHELTVEEAAKQGLEEDNSQEASVEESSTAGRYGFHKAVSD